MSKVSRRTLITTGIVAAAGASGLAVSAKIARDYGLIPPDGGGLYGPGETLTYAAQRVLTRHSLAREFQPSQISKPPFANEVDALGDNFKRLQAGGFADWRLAVDGMVAHPASFSVSDLKSFPAALRSRIWRVKRGGLISRSGPVCRSRTFSMLWGRFRRRATLCTVHFNRTGGTASTWRMRFILKRSSRTA